MKHIFERATVPATVRAAILMLGIGSTLALSRPAAAVQFSEIHYDNTGTDQGEFFELEDDAGTDLTGWSVVLYNGSNGTVYDTISLSGTFPATGRGAIAFSLPTNGLQNGSPDGLALVDAMGAVVEFISYEGSFTPSSGPAAGQTSTDIGVSEPASTAVGQSLQRPADTWFGPLPESPNVVNIGVTEFHYDNAGADTGEFIEVTGPAGIDLSGWSLVLYNGNGGVVYDTVNLSGTLDEEGATAVPI